MSSDQIAAESYMSAATIQSILEKYPPETYKSFSKDEKDLLLLMIASAHFKKIKPKHFTDLLPKYKECMDYLMRGPEANGVKV